MTLIGDHTDLLDLDSTEVGVFTRDDRVCLREIDDYLMISPESSQRLALTARGFPSRSRQRRQPNRPIFP
jgi:hypothetical protein